MTCEQFLEIVATKTVLELTDAERRPALTHLHGCAACKAHLATSELPLTKFERESNGGTRPTNKMA